MQISKRPERAVLERMLKENPGISETGLARLHGVAHGTMHRYLAHYGLQTDRRRRRQRDNVVKLFNEGYTTPYRLAAKMGVAWMTAKRYLLRHGLIEDGRGKQISADLPPCEACGDPVDDDPVWGGVDGLHHTCRRFVQAQREQRPLVDQVEAGQVVVWEGEGTLLQGQVKAIKHGVAFIWGNGRAFRIPLGSLDRIVLRTGRREAGE